DGPCGALTVGAGSGDRAGLVVRARSGVVGWARGVGAGLTALLLVLALTVLLLELTDFGLEDPGRLADAAGGIRQLLEAEQKEDEKGDDDDFGSANAR